jgi:Uma2 family endonuclease
MNTKKKNSIKYEMTEEEPLIVGERFFAPPTLNLDLTKRYTYADYLTWMDSIRRELIDGFIHILGAPLRIHALITVKLSRIFDWFIIKKKGKCHIYYAPINVRLPIEGSIENDKIYNVVQPDICVVCDLSKLDDMGCIGAPDLIVEILSPSTAKKDWNHKFNLYEKAGVREYWIVGPKTKKVHVFILQPNGKYDSGTEYDCTQKAPVHIFEGLEIDLKELFENDL